VIRPRGEWRGAASLAFALLLFLVAGGLVAQTLPPPASEGVVKLTRRERKERTAKLEEKYQQFLIDVEPIMLDTERDAFLIMESDAQRDLFIEDFWRRHEAAEGVPKGSFKQLYYDRLETAKARYRSAISDRSRAYLIHGEPAEVLKSDRCELLQPLEVWTFINTPGFSERAEFLFYVPREGVDYVLWQPYGSGDNALYDLVSRGVVATEGTEAAALQRVFGVMRGTTMTHLQQECRDADNLLRAIESVRARRLDNSKLFKPRAVDPEEARKILHSVVMPTSGAKALPAELSVAYPGRQGDRTATELTVLVPKSPLVLKDVGGLKLYSLDVVGEVLKDQNLLESFRYRFDYPASVESDHLGIVIDRILRPGPYKARLKIADLNANTEAILESSLTVPEVADSPEAKKRKLESATALSAIKDQIESDGPSLRIAPLPDELLSGLQRIDAVVSGEGITGVEFYLDGRKVMTKRQRPYTLDLDFGSVPQVHRVRAVALNDKGEVIAGDDVTVNTGNDPFRVRIVSPRVALKLHGRTRVEMAVDVPEGKKLEKLELFLGETRVATLYGPPYVQVVDVPQQEGVGYFRAVASLQDVPEQPPIEDVVTFNTAQYMEEVNVHLVELPTTVLRAGHPVNDLAQDAFTVLDEGKPVKVARFEHVTNLPLSIGLAIDTSASMQPRMAEAQKAGSQFLTNTLRKGDRAFLVSFDSQPQLIQRWSANVSDMNAGLAKLRADESTALYDAIVYSLYNFMGVKGQKAMVLITDGHDTASKFTFDKAIEYARRAAVPIYAIGIGIGPADVDTRYKLGKFTTETGGNVYYIDRAEDLHKIYTDIQNELRSQYILGFYPAEGIKPGAKWHELTVQVVDGKAKTIRGYYP
jgi:VWFA-related protein